MLFFTVRVEEKTASLLYILKNIIEPSQKTIIFTSTRHHVEYLYSLLTEYSFSCCVVYGTMDQAARKISVGKFRNGQVQIMLVTDVAARGIDIPILDNVINYDFPCRSKLFVHRVGRVARMNRIGYAYSLVSSDEIPYMLDLYLFLGREPLNNIPENSTYNDKDIYYGKIPQHLIDFENESIKDKLKLHPDIVYFL